MAGFVTRQAIIDALRTKGKFNEVHFRKINAAGGAGAASFYQEYFTATGSPDAISFSGTAGAAVQLTSSTSGALTSLPEGNVSTDRRFLLNAQFTTTATNADPGVVVLADLLLYYPNVSVNTPTTLNNSITLPRYTDGKGVYGLVQVNTASDLGATTPQLTLTYTGSDNSSHAAVTTAPAASLRKTRLFHNSVTPYLQFDGNISGIKKIDSYTVDSGGTATGGVDFVLFKPLATIPIVSAATPTEIDFVNDVVSLPRIYDGACLGFIIMPGGNLSSSAVLTGRIQYGWD